MIIEHESENYAWVWDGLMGVGRFKRKADEALTFLETGTEACDVRRSLNRLKQKTGSKDYPGPSFNELFDSIAEEYTYHV